MNSPFAGGMSDGTGFVEQVMIHEEYPEEIKQCLEILDRARELVIKGEVEALSIYVDRRDDCYETLQSRGPVSRQEDAGRMLEFMMRRLGYAKTADLVVEDDE